MKTNSEFFAALDLLEQEKNIPKEYMYDKIKAAIASTIKRDRNVPVDNVDVVFDEDKKTMRAFIRKTVVEQPVNPSVEISLDEARQIDGKYELGDTVEEDINPSSVGRIAAKVGKNVIIQAINEAVNGSMVQEFESRKGSVVSATVRSVEYPSGNALVEVGSHELILHTRDQIPGEKYTENQVIKVCINVSLPELKNNYRPKEVILSRTNPDFIRGLFEIEVPEIGQGTVSVKAVSREAGSRCKVAVYSSDPNVDAVGSCIGPHQSRINAILSNLSGERIDLIRYSDDPAEFVAAALSPASVRVLEINTADKTCRVVVPAQTLSLAIGKGGQNVRLAARLTGYKIDIVAE